VAELELPGEAPDSSGVSTALVAAAVGAEPTAYADQILGWSSSAAGTDLLA
jgi:hypothetical protein